MRRVVTHYQFTTDKPVPPLKAALVCDLHGAPFDDLLEPLSQADVILVGGDLVDGYDQEISGGLAFLREAVKLAPVYYAPGNHEGYFTDPVYGRYMAQAKEAGAVLLHNTFVRRSGYAIAGVTDKPNFSMLRRFEREIGYKILLCHRPEMYARTAKERQVDLTLSGHAHGGQIRLFGRGLYAPGQGILPKFSGGVYEGGRLLVSRGLTNTVCIPRIGNPCELVMIEIQPEK